MSSIFLADYVANAEFALERQVPLLAANALKPRVGIHAMCTMFRKRGACVLLLTGDSDVYYLTAMQSAAAYLEYLGRAPEEDKVTSFAKPFFDSIAGGYWDAAREIAARSRASHHPDFEYEDDFLYVRFLQERFFLGATEAALMELLARYEAVGEGRPDVRLDLCRTFAGGDSDAFDETLQELLRRRADELESLVSRGGTTEEEATWLRPYSNEATALLKLAERLGFPTQSSYSQVPNDVRPLSPFSFSADAWRTLDFVPTRRS
jgi:hypothetical protein